MALVVSTGVRGRHSQVGSLAGAAHLLKDNAGVLRSVLIEFTLGHLRYLLTDVPPQPNSPPDYVFRAHQC